MPKAMKDTDRSFTCEKSSFMSTSSGRYVSKNAFNAAKKAARQQFKKAETESSLAKFKNATVVYLMMQEITMGGNKKAFFYKATKKSVNKTFTINGQKIPLKMEVEIEAVSEDVFLSQVKKASSKKA